MNRNKVIAWLFGSILLVFYMAVSVLAADEITVSDYSLSYEKTEHKTELASGNQSTSGGGTNVVWDGSKFTITATNSKKYKSWFKTYYAQNYTATLKLTNTSGTTLTVSYKTEDIDGIENDSYTKKLLNGESVVFSVSSVATSTTTESNTVTGYVTIEDVTAMTGADIYFDSASHGSYTYTIDGQAVDVAANSEISGPISIAVGSTVTLTAGAAEDGYTFYGWGAGNRLLGTADGDYTIEDSITIYPIFLRTQEMNKGEAFQVGTNTYMLWSHAFADAESTGNTVVLLRDYALPNTLEGNGLKESDTYVMADSVGNVTYIIPKNTNFVVPYSGSDVGDFDGSPDAKGASHDSASIGTRSAYRTLTVGDGVTVSCKGNLNLNAQQFATSNNYPGCVMGQYGLLKLDGENAKLNVSGKLFCYGYVIGTGTVEITSGGELYELMQLMDWRGGNATSSAIQKSLFPFSQYFIQNVEAELIVDSGASAYVCVAIEAGLISKSVYQITPEFIGNGGFFQLGSNAKIIRDYDTANDCMNYTVADGAATVSGMELSLSNYSMNTAEFVFAITPNMNLTVADTAEISFAEDYKLLPNVSVVVNGSALVQGDLYIYDYADWIAGNYAYNSTYSRVLYIATTGKGSSRTLAAESASLTVNGTMTVTGGVYTTSSNNSTDKVIKGKGTFVNNASSTSVTTVTEGSMKTGTVSSTETTQIPVSLVLGNLAGVGDLKSFGAGTYTGLGSAHNNYWYTAKADIAASCDEGAYTAYSCAGNDGVYKIYTDEEALGHIYVSEVTTQPTLTNTGVMTYTCTRCGDSYIEEIACLPAVAKIGETRYALLTEALAAVEERGTITLLAVPEDVVEIAQNVTIVVGNLDYKITCAEGWGAVDNEDGSFTIKEGVFKIYASNVKVGDCLDMYFYVDKTDLEGEGYYAKIIKTYSDNRADAVVTVPYKDWTTYLTSYMRFSFNGIAAKEMTDEVYVTIYHVGDDNEIGTEDDTVASTKCEDSIENYAIRTLNNTTDQQTALRTILVDMLNYGAACQIEFEYNTSDIATAQLNDTQKGYATTQEEWETPYTDSSEMSTNFYGSSVVTESQLIYRLYFSDLVPTETMTANIVYTDFYGNLEYVEVVGTEFKYSTQYARYYVDIEGLAISDGRQLINCVIKDLNSSDHTEMEVAFCKNDSIEACVRRFEGNETAANAYNMLLNFVYSAVAYFGSN